MSYETYCNIKPKNRTQELELIAFAKMTGEDIYLALKSFDEELAEEYNKISYGDLEE